ncbi:MAG TPA: saccharopine dehydrogenase NADP-binding domain-containing protein [Thermoanaerobaculia bacterium]|nr:saccharopine dehydrogenase NADP-binding domain-containing protein [Thermoanaerobaculia bacterium]
MAPKGADRLLLYGANGYTGRLIAEEARRRGLPLVLAGRRAEAVEPLATALSCPSLCFPLEDPEIVARMLQPFRALLLAAGPFSRTSAPALDACLKAGTSYLDITGEIDVFEACFARHDEAVKAGIAVLPGTGFDVVPSDGLAASLAAKLPEAHRLELAFRGFKTSAGTMKTMIEGMPKGGAARVDGRIVRVPPAWKTKTIPFPDKPRLAMTIPWGDVSTAFRSTGIENIEVYMAVPPSAISAAKRGAFFAPVLGWGFVQDFLKARVERNVVGPTEEERRRERSFLWGRVSTRNAEREVTGTLETPEGYALTALTAVACAEKVLAGEVKPGAWTPSQAFGARFIETIPGCRLAVPA